MVNQLNDPMETGKGHAALKSILDGLIQYTASHFSDEERVMAQHNYPDLAMHKKAHEKPLPELVLSKGFC
ncbi:hemerythrin family protein [Geobacter pelophilus]|uniref:Hemerythrin family protein n=1 Tax=Geoanaerobacter pelophilus TaxID=60036 RepID=A0AAW4LD65_9BACT|nr:hemerythrin family protein [Geoanaerobacter pelophilus]